MPRPEERLDWMGVAPEDLTLREMVKNGMNVTAFPLYKLTDIPEALRAVANALEHGGLDAVRCVLVLEADDGSVDYKAFGDEPFTRAHAIGLCFSIAKEIAP